MGHAQTATPAVGSGLAGPRAGRHRGLLGQSGSGRPAAGRHRTAIRTVSERQISSVSITLAALVPAGRRRNHRTAGRAPPAHGRRFRGFARAVCRFAHAVRGTRPNRTRGHGPRAASAVNAQHLPSVLSQTLARGADGTVEFCARAARRHYAADSHAQGPATRTDAAGQGSGSHHHDPRRHQAPLGAAARQNGAGQLQFRVRAQRFGNGRSRGPGASGRLDGDPVRFRRLGSDFDQRSIPRHARRCAGSQPADEDEFALEPISLEATPSSDACRRCSESSCTPTYTPVPALRRHAPCFVLAPYRNGLLTGVRPDHPGRRLSHLDHAARTRS